MSCKYCGKPVILIPSAKERARHNGKTPSYYTRLFPDHASCIVDNRNKESRKLLIEIKNRQNYYIQYNRRQLKGNT